MHKLKTFEIINFKERSSLWNPYPVGNPSGGIQVVGRDIRLEQSQIAAATAGTGQGGSITVNAARSLSLGGVNPNAQAPSAWIVNQVAPKATGNGGAVNIRAGQLTLHDGAAIQTLSLGAYPISPTLISGIDNFTTGSGNGGNVSVTTPKLTLQAGAILSASTLLVLGIFGDAKQSNNLGNGGNVTVNVADRLTITGINRFTKAPTVLGTNTLGNGKAGDVTIKTNHLVIQDGASINTITQATGNAGALTIQANDILIEGKNILSSAIAKLLITTTFYKAHEQIPTDGIEGCQVY